MGFLYGPLYTRLSPLVLVKCHSINIPLHSIPLSYITFHFTPCHSTTWDGISGKRGHDRGEPGYPQLLSLSTLPPLPLPPPSLSLPYLPSSEFIIVVQSLSHRPPKRCILSEYSGLITFTYTDMTFIVDRQTASRYHPYLPFPPEAFHPQVSPNSRPNRPGIKSPYLPTD